MGLRPRSEALVRAVMHTQAKVKPWNTAYSVHWTAFTANLQAARNDSDQYRNARQ